MRNQISRLAALSMSAAMITGAAAAQTYEETIACEYYIQTMAMQLGYGSENYNKAMDLRSGWVRAAKLMAPANADPDAMKRAESEKFNDVMMNGTGADKQAYHQSFQKCASPPEIVDLSIPAKICATFALYLKDTEESSKQSRHSHLMRLENEGASEEDMAEAQAKLALHNENAKRAYHIHRAYTQAKPGIRLEGDSFNIHDLNERTDVLTACEAG